MKDNNGIPISVSLIEVYGSAQWADLATERERQLTTARANQIIGLTNRWATNWAPEVVFSTFRGLPVVKWRGGMELTDARVR